MPLEFNLFIFLACKWDIVPLNDKRMLMNKQEKKDEHYRY